MPPVKKPLRARDPHFLLQWRQYRKLTQERVAELVEIDPATLSRLERGLIPYDQDILEKLALVYGCEAADLIKIDPAKPDPPSLVFDRLRAAPPDVRARALVILDALLKAG